MTKQEVYDELEDARDVGDRAVKIAEMTKRGCSLNEIGPLMEEQARAAGRLIESLGIRIISKDGLFPCEIEGCASDIIKRVKPTYEIGMTAQEARSKDLPVPAGVPDHAFLASDAEKSRGNDNYGNVTISIDSYWSWIFTPWAKENGSRSFTVSIKSPRCRNECENPGCHGCAKAEALEKPEHEEN